MVLLRFRERGQAAMRGHRNREAVGEPFFLFSYLRILVPKCAKEKEHVNNFVCLQDPGSNLHMIKLI